MTPEERQRGEKLRDIVEHLKGKPCVYGEDDCSIICAQWAADETGRELEWPLYGTREEAEAIIEREGGLVAVWEGVARKAGLERHFLGHDEIPGVGDIGIIETGEGPVGVIFLAGCTIIWRAERGVRVIGVRRHTIKAVWKV